VSLEPVVKVQGLSKRFYKADPHRPRTLQAFVLQRVRNLRGGRGQNAFWALDGVTFQVEPGKMLGIIGRNGAGKSTLLRLLGGVGQPDAGQVHLDGRIGALIDLGAGFHPDLTGVENIYLNGVIAGLTRREVADRYEKIVEFAELEGFIYSPLRTYSTGMQMRLAFSVAIHTSPSILLIDEVLAVGDMAFQHKCLERISQLRQSGCAILLVSHDASLVRRMCDEALWLDRGKVMALGPAPYVVEQYRTAMQHATRSLTPSVEEESPVGNLRLGHNRLGSQEMVIEGVQLLDENGSQAEVLPSGGGLVIVLQYYAPQPVEGPIFGVTLSQGEDSLLYDTSTESGGLSLPLVQGRGEIVLTLERLDLAPGVYNLDVGVYRSDWEYAYDYHYQAYSFTIEAPPGEKGLLRPPHHWELRGEK
jgi:lipopolysaccharide transport system ATP-binding protein